MHGKRLGFFVLNKYCIKNVTCRVTAARLFSPELTVDSAPEKTPATKSPGTKGISPKTCITKRGNS